MAKFSYLVIMLICFTKELVSLNPAWVSDQDNLRTVKISFSSRKNETGHWVDNLSAQAIANEASDDVGMNLTKTTINYGGKRYIQIGGISDVFDPASISDKLVFDRNCGKNVIVVNGGRTLRKKKQADWSYALAFTNRPLKDNEIFQVRLNNLSNTGSIIIGVTENKPESASLYEVFSAQFQHWAYLGEEFQSDSGKKNRNDGISLDELQVGETVGVMKTESGDLHLFFDGVDVGVGATYLPSRVYGFFDLYGVGQRATIVYS